MLKFYKKSSRHIFFEIIWINDGSNDLNTKILKKMLYEFENTTRFVSVIYSENDGNKGIGYTLNKGVSMCNNEIIIKMDSDDIMVPNRIQLQLEYMKKSHVICGGQIAMFYNVKEKVHNITKHPDIFRTIQKIYGHIGLSIILCYRKSKILEAGL